METKLIDRRVIPTGAAIASWTAPDGWPLRTLAWPQANSAKVRGSLIFAGGRGDFIEKYLEPLAHWHRLGWNVTSFDWRSQGESQGDIRGGHLDSFDALATDGAALIEAWTAEAPGPHAAIGHSMGGHLLLRIIAEHQLRLDAAVLVAPMIGINSWPLPPALAQLVAQGFCMLGWSSVPVWSGGGKFRTGDGSQRSKILTSCAERYADELWWLQQRPGFSLGSPTWGWLNAAFRSVAKLTPAKLEAIDLPVLMLGTERDRLVSPAAIRWAAGLLPKAELIMYRTAAHELLREADPVRLDALARIDAFLDAHLPA
jgi:lysophospholipase